MGTTHYTKTKVTENSDQRLLVEVLSLLHGEMADDLNGDGRCFLLVRSLNFRVVAVVHRERTSTVS